MRKFENSLKCYHKLNGTLKDIIMALFHQKTFVLFLYVFVHNVE
jgi:hypothetical protein